MVIVRLTSVEWLINYNRELFQKGEKFRLLYTKSLLGCYTTYFRNLVDSIKCVDKLSDVDFALSVLRRFDVELYILSEIYREVSSVELEELLSKGIAGIKNSRFFAKYREEHKQILGKAGEYYRNWWVRRS